MFREIKRVDMEMIEVNNDFIRTQTHLKHVSGDYSKLKDSINSRFKVISFSFDMDLSYGLHERNRCFCVECTLVFSIKRNNNY